ncbi:MAG TPA: hypothetical protein VF791_11695 [Pyrinomonadaceae bacterium]
MDSTWNKTDAALRQTLTANARRFWLFSAPVDLGVFLGSAVVSLLALWIGARAGVLDEGTPEWTWIPAVLLIDVAHVWSTAFRVYFDGEELRRRAWLYALVPVIGYAIGVALYSEGEIVFWRALAYLAVFHFIRQQYGWVMLYRARLGERDRLGRILDTATIYLATLYPLIYWHTHLPRAFWWFLANDFAALPSVIERILRPIYWTVLGLYACRSVSRWLVKGEVNPGKDIVVLTTAVCWYVGIIAYNSDYAFTVTNVIIHGVPYLALVYWYARTRRVSASAPYRRLARGPITFLLTLWLIAYVEELLWDRGVWHERAWLFGGSWDVGTLKVLLVPLLALPQLTHYVLDGFIWRRKSNPSFSLISTETQVK